MNKLIATIAAATSILALAGCTNHEVRQATAVQHHLTISQAQYENNDWVDDGTVKTITLLMTTNTDGWTSFCRDTFYGEPILDHGVAQCDMNL